MRKIENPFGEEEGSKGKGEEQLRNKRRQVRLQSLIDDFTEFKLMADYSHLIPRVLDVIDKRPVTPLEEASKEDHLNKL